MDQLGFIILAGTKRKSIHRTVQIHDCRDHCKQALHLALADQEWSEVIDADIDLAINAMEIL